MMTCILKTCRDWAHELIRELTWLLTDNLLVICYSKNLNGGDARNIGEVWWEVEGSALGATSMRI